MVKNSRKKSIKVFIYIAGIYIICINLIVLVSFTVLVGCNGINIKEYFLSLLFILFSSGLYFSVYRYYLVQKVYRIQAFGNKYIIYTYNKEYVFDKKEILSQQLSWQSFFRLTWRINVKINDRGKIFYVKEKL